MTAPTQPKFRMIGGDGKELSYPMLRIVAIMVLFYALGYWTRWIT